MTTPVMPSWHEEGEACRARSCSTLHLLIAGYEAIVKVTCEGLAVALSTAWVPFGSSLSFLPAWSQLC